MRVLIVPNHSNAEAVRAARSLASHLAATGRTAVMLAEDAAACGLPELAVARDGLGGLELVVALGGDGTMLRAAHADPDSGTPILGVNLGRLGFLSGAGPELLPEAVDRALAGEGRLETRSTLSVRLMAGGREAGAFRAVNEVVVGRSAVGRVVELEVRVNGHSLSRYYCDGVIVATPTGSTAYSLSLGGPIVNPAVAGFLVVPAAAHTLTARPMVLAAGDTAEICFPNPSRADVTITIDGETVPCRTMPERVSVTLGGPEIELVKLDGTDFYEVVRAKFLGG